MKQKKKIILLFTICMLIFVFSAFQSQAKTFGATRELDFNSSFSVGYKVSKNQNIKWSFNGSNSLVGIIVLAMDENNYNIFMDDAFSAFAYTLSDGSYYSHYGTFKAKSSDKWWIAFINLDGDMLSTSITYKVEFPYMSTGLYIAIIGGLSVMVVIVAIVSYKQKKKNKHL